MANISYKEFIRQGMRMMGLKGQPVDVIRDAMRSLAREWVSRRITNTVPKATADEVAKKLLGGR